MLSDDYCIALTYLKDTTRHEYCARHKCNTDCKYYSPVSYDGTTCMMAQILRLAIKILEIKNGDPP